MKTKILGTTNMAAVLFLCRTWFVVLKKEEKLIIFSNKGFGRM
jgi:hypothetical protein